MTRLLAATSVFALALAACGPGYDEPGSLESELETEGSEPGDAVSWRADAGGVPADRFTD